MSEPSHSAQRPRRTKIAIFGAGLGAMAAAYEPTSQPRGFERYEVTIYQKGWRQGGEGASGRGRHGRIEEHRLQGFWVPKALVRIRQSGGEDASPLGLLHPSDVAARTLPALAGPGPLPEWSPLSRIGRFIRTLLGRPYARFFSLRQLRDGRLPSRAAFQKVTRARMSLGELAMRRPRSRHSIERVEHAGHPIARELGLGEGPLTPSATLHVHVADATLERDNDDGALD